MSRSQHRLPTPAVLAMAPALSLVLLFSTPGLVGGAVAAPAPAGSETAPTTPSTYKAPTAEELAAKQAEVARLTAQVGDQAKALADAQARAAELIKKLETAHDAEVNADAAEASAKAEQTLQQQRLTAATALVDQRQEEGAAWAAKTYRDGQLGGVEKMMALLGSKNTDDVAQRMQMLDLVGRWRGSVVDTVEEARAVQADASVKSQAAADAATKARSDAAAARASAETAVNEQTTQLMVINTLLTQAQAQSAQAQADTTAMTEAMQKAMMAATAGSSGSNQITGPVDPNCRGGDISGFSNGQIPTELLCGLVNNPNHRLRADAAKAFNDMSMAYAAQFGATICVTDSYRTLSGQIAVKAAKPGLAAKPGTSKHGLARAVDLCGGIQSFGTSQHVWMQQNASKYGWCNPRWAQAGGSKPEAWHWQYMDCVH